MADQDPQLDLKKRARRRLVGAAALALLAAIVLPLVMDQEPKPVGQDIQIRIPSQGTPGAPFSVEKPAPPVVSPVASTPTAEPAAPATTPVVPVVVPLALPPSAPETNASVLKPSEAKSDTKSTAKATPQQGQGAAIEKARAEAILNGTPAQPAAGSGKYVVQLGVFSDAGNVKKLRERIKAQGYNSFTETIKADKGMKTRVRAGPFTSRDAAMKARDRLKQHMGIDGIVAEK